MTYNEFVAVFTYISMMFILIDRLAGSSGQRVMCY